MKINCVILNYNDAETVLGLVEEIRGYQVLNQIVIVDNASTDDSWQKLKRLLEYGGEEQQEIGAGEDGKVRQMCAGKIQLLRAEKNGGYGAGNNLGVRHAVKENGSDYVLIANPDVKFTEACVKALAGTLKCHPELAATAARMEDPSFGDAVNGWKLHGFWGELFSMGPVCRRVLKPWLNDPKQYFQGKKAVYVDAVHGSMLMVDGKKFLDAGGYDEEIFLYQEEAVLAKRFQRLGYRTALLLTQTYRHEHSVSISKSFKGQMDRQKLRNASVLYYLKRYLGIGPVREVIAKAWFAGILTEIRIAEWVRKIV